MRGACEVTLIDMLIFPIPAPAPHPPVDKPVCVTCVRYVCLPLVDILSTWSFRDEQTVHFLYVRKI